MSLSELLEELDEAEMSDWHAKPCPLCGLHEPVDIDEGGWWCTHCEHFFG